MADLVDLPSGDGGVAECSSTTCGSASVWSASARPAMPMPGKIAPPANAPSVSTRSTVIAVPKINNDRCPIGRAQMIGGNRGEQPIDADALRFFDANWEGNVFVG